MSLVSDARSTRAPIIAAEEMDEADNELREVICKLWPNLAKKPVKLHEGGTKTLLDLIVPPKHGKENSACSSVSNDRTFAELHGVPGFPKLTVGKVYAICMYIDNYRSNKQGHSNDTVSANAPLALDPFRLCRHGLNAIV